MCLMRQEADRVSERWLVQAAEEDVEYILFTTDRFGYITLGKIYEVRINCSGEPYVFDDEGREYYWFGASKGIYLKINHDGPA